MTDGEVDDWNERKREVGCEEQRDEQRDAARASEHFTG